MTAPKPPPALLKFRRKLDDKPAILRWATDTWEGRPYVSARIWTLGSDGDEYPTKQGITIRESEIDAVIEALTRARDQMRSAK